MAKEFLGKGWKFPVTVDTRTKNMAMSEYEQDIQEAVGIILSTSKGERVMQPDFGCDLQELVFAPMNTATLSLVESHVWEALTLWEPRIELTTVEVSAKSGYEGKLLVNIEYRVRLTNTRFNLVYPFYLTEGA